MSEDESFDSFYGRLNEIVNAKLNLGEKIEETKVVWKVLRSLPKSLQVKVTTIEERKDLDAINIQELVGSLQTYELGLTSYKSSKSLALKTVNEKANDSSDEDDVEKEVAYLAKNFRKFLKMKNNGKPFGKGRSSSFKKDFNKDDKHKKEAKWKNSKDSTSTQGIICYECNGHGHLKRECPNHLRSKGKVLTTILSDSKNSSSDLEDDCDGDGNNFAFMAITSIDSKDELDELNEELGEHTDVEEVEASDDENEYLEEGDRKIQDAYDAFLEDCGKYAKVAKNAVKKMKKIEEDHNYTLVQLKGAKCEVEDLKEELLNAYSKIKFLELEVIQENAKVEHVLTKKLHNVLTSQKTFSNKTGLQWWLQNIYLGGSIRRYILGKKKVSLAVYVISLLQNFSQYILARE